MKVEVLYFEGCPNHAPVLGMVRRVLDREKIQAEVRLIEVTNEKDAESARFLGSPSVRVNGVDINPGRYFAPGKMNGWHVRYSHLQRLTNA